MMDWKEYNISIDSDAEEIVSNVLIELGANGVSIRSKEDLKKLPKNELDMLWELDKDKFPNNGVIVTAYF
ncbi:MAG: 50S ribosomal protein L11 methyltransferase, partial [Atopostipes suicloacalis]|nr:50S ribosomal protein L11 methyltransferase [Atopostipes suicloacalis]